MDQRTRELVAIGASMTANCQPCVQYHMNKARRCDVSADDIQEAVTIARMVRRGAKAKMDAFVDEEELGERDAEDGTRERGTGSRCCG